MRDDDDERGMQRATTPKTDGREIVTKKEGRWERPFSSESRESTGPFVFHAAAK